MRVLDVPIQDSQVVYQMCTNSIGDANLRNRLNAVTSYIADSAIAYEQRAKVGELYSIPPNNCGNEEVVVGAVTKGELKDVYSSHMVGRSKPARVVYDQLLSEAPLGKCPFCGFGHVSTLDHYLPKSKYPLIAVLPLNLVPSCKDCNTGKSSAIAITQEEQCLHPYFDHHKFVTEQWLYAAVEHTRPANIRFYVRPPDHWDDVSKKRVQSHFNDFSLASRYAVEASNQLACLRDTLVSYRELLGTEAVKQHLEIEANTYSKQHSNSWQTAMFYALASSDWFCGGGFS